MALTDSPFVNRLHTNYVPSDSEIIEIRSLLVDPADELARIDAQIQPMAIALSQLRDQRCSLQGQIDAHMALLAPIRRIPHDVLLEIFFSCLPTEHNTLIDPDEAPLVLGRICRHWRQIAYSAPILWSSIQIPCTYEIPSATMVQSWLARSTPCSLSVSLRDETCNSYVEIHPILVHFLQASSRLRRLELRGKLESFRPLLHLGPENLLLLKSLRIATVDYPPAEWDANPLAHTDILRVPTLDDVSLRISGVADPLSYPLPWGKLTRLALVCQASHHEEAGVLNADGALRVLRRSPNLRHCLLRISAGDPFGMSTDMSPVVLPQLETLAFTGLCEFQKWISHLDVPKLCSLRVGTKYEEIDPGSFSDHETRVDLYGVFFASSSLQELLQSFPNISHLHLTQVQLNLFVNHLQPIFLDDMFLALFGAPHNLCPLLTHFTVQSCAAFSDAAALAFVKAKMAMPTPLQLFQVYFMRPRQLDIVPDLRSFMSNGLEVDLKYSDTRVIRRRPASGFGSPSSTDTSTGFASFGMPTFSSS
ncbi:hypothetical protein C8R45DRAFT_967086 [Mycena sanguinolenta]|nr:hypothetical protein C8R45DRAFT_967086 [Mycena sanguinolenta]